jgi:hypothetical protein
MFYTRAGPLKGEVRARRYPKAITVRPEMAEDRLKGFTPFWTGRLAKP